MSHALHHHSKLIAPFSIFLLVYAIYVSLTYKDYCITWDEGDVIGGGKSYFAYYFWGHQASDATSNTHFRTHNYIYPVWLMAATLNQEVPVEVYHLLNMLFAVLLYGGAYLLFRREFHHSYWALAGPLALFLTPVLMGHIPANPKDAPTAIVYTLALIVFYFTAHLPLLSWKRVLAVGAVIGVASSFRLSGLTLFPTLLLFDLWNGMDREATGWRKWAWREAASLAAVLAVSQVTMVLLWPYLAADYFGRILQILRNGMRFEWMCGTQYFGRGVSSLSLPWHFLPVWLVITTPLCLLFFAVLAVLPRFRRHRDTWVALSAACLTANLGVWLVARPYVYHGVRHYLFLLPVVTLLGARVLTDFIRHFALRDVNRLRDKAIVAGVILNLSWLVVTLFSIHPYEYIYYNELVGGFKGGVKWFEKDYWATTDREAIRWISDHMKVHAKTKVKVSVTGHVWQGIYYLTPDMEYCLPEAPWDYAVVQADANLNPVEQSRIVHTITRMGTPLCHVLFVDRTLMAGDPSKKASYNR